MELNNKKITVIGAGVGGLAAAILLRQRGAEVTVLEQAKEIAEVGAGLQISPNGVAVMRALGLADDLSWCAQRAQAVVLREHRRGREVVRLDLNQYAHDLRYYFVHRYDLIAFLAEEVRRLGVHVRLLQKVESVEPGDRPTVYLANGDQCHADLVVGADGLHSRARAALNADSTAQFTGQVAWRAIVPNRWAIPAEAQLFMGPGRHLVAYPLRDGSSLNVVAVQERKAWAEEGWSHRDDPENLRAAFVGFGGIASEILNSVRDVHLWGLFRHEVAQTWGRDRVAILGDAAHPTLPFMAQGANMALEDAYALADCLATSDTAEAALSRYQHRRRARASRVIQAANQNVWKYHLRPPLNWPAHQVLSLMGRIAPEKMVSQFDWIYRHDETAH